MRRNEKGDGERKGKRKRKSRDGGWRERWGGEKKDKIRVCIIILGSCLLDSARSDKY